MTTQKVNGVGTTSSSGNVKAQSGRNFPDDKTLKKAAEQLGISVEQLKAHLSKSKVPTNRKSIYALVDNNKMDMKTFCILNGIDYNKWRDYKAGADEMFFVINNPKQYIGKKVPETAVKSKNTAQIPAQKPAKKVQVKAPAKVQTPATVNRAKYGSDYTPTELAKMIFAKSKEYYGAVGKPDFDALINQINPKNASIVLKEYKKISNETLMTTLSHEIRSDKDKRKAAMLHVYDALAGERGTPASIKEGFKKELENQFDSFGMVNTKKLDTTLNRMMASAENIALWMKNEIHSKWGAVGRDSFNELTALVTQNNAEQVIKAYTGLKTGESLIEGITSEVKSSKESRKAAVMHIYDMLAKQKGVPASKRAEFENELNAQFNSFGFVNTKKLDEMINSMINSSTPSVANKNTTKPYSKDDSTKITLGNGKTYTAEQLRRGAISSAKKDEGFKDVKNPYIVRPLPNVNSNGKIEAMSEIHPSTNKNGPLKGKVVIVNAGHGGYSAKNGFFDSGTVLSVNDANGQKRPIEEWRVSGTYTEDLTKKLQAKGATVVVVSGPVRNGGMADDKYLENLLVGQRGSADVRKLFKNTKKSNIAFVSIHVESVKDDPSKKVCTVRANNDDGDLALAKKIQQHVGKNIFCLRPEIATNDYYVTRAMGPEIPAVLLELGNIANDNIAASLLSENDRGKYTQAVADALEETLLNK